MTVHHVDVPAPADATPLVLLPSNGLCAEFYLPLGAVLAEQGLAARLVTLPGYDGTAPLPEPTIDALLDAIAPTVREGLGDGGVLVGHSLGGLLAFLLVPRLDGRVRRLVLMEPALPAWAFLARSFARFYTWRAVDVARDDFRNTGAGFVRIHDPETFPPEAMAIATRVADTTDPAMIRQLVASAGELRDGPFDQLPPTLLVRGGGSGIFIRIGMALLARRIRGSVSVVIEDAGHWLANEQDDAIADAIRSFAT